MNFLNIKYFLELEKTRNFTQAARNLYITQQTLSANIASIEEELGNNLFTRTRPIELTYAGKEFLAYAKRFDRLNTMMKEEFADLSNESKEVLRVGVGYSRAQNIIPMVLKEMKELHPKLELRINDGNNKVLTNLLEEKEIDLAITRENGDDPAFDSETLYKEQFLILIPDVLLENYFGSQKDDILANFTETMDFSVFDNCPFLMLFEGHHIRNVADGLFLGCNFKPNIFVYSDKIDILYHLCLSNFGITFYIRSFFHESEEKMEEFFRKKGIHCIPVNTQKYVYEVSIISLKNAYKTAAMRDFIQISKKVFQTKSS